MNNIPIFDSLTHPTIDSNWILPRYPECSSIEILKEQMQKANVGWAFAVGMKDIGGYKEKEYIKMITDAADSNIFPIAFYHPDSKEYSEIKKDLISIKKLGYHGIKLHPRISDFSLTDQISLIIKTANDLGLICMLCTYPYSHNHANKITPEQVMEMLAMTGEAKVILMHSGAVRLLEYMEVARVFNNVLLDLSLTLCKYEGSSIDLDLVFMFQHFDRRICIGSDFPEYPLSKLRDRFEILSSDIGHEKKENIAYKNISSFCGLIISA